MNIMSGVTKKTLSLKRDTTSAATSITTNHENWNYISRILVEILVFALKFIWIILESIVKLIIPVPEKSVKGEITVITGAGHGIGRELAFQYASNGAIVVCLDINKGSNEETVKEIKRLGYRAHAYVCNVANREEVFAVAKLIQKDVGDVSILINNAGVLVAQEFLSCTPEQLQRMININVVAHFWTIHAFLPRMIELNQGHIVALSSCAGILGTKYLAAYSATKFAVRGLMEALFYELRERPNCQVQLTTIYPHMVDTGLCKQPVIPRPLITPLLKPYDAAKHIISAQRRNVLETTIPGRLFVMNYIGRTMPDKLFHLIGDTFLSYVQPDKE